MTNAKKHNRKGMTLIEVIIAMTILGIASTMIVMSLVYAVKANAYNYKRAKEVSYQSNYAENYDDTKVYAYDEADVNPYSIGGTNSVDLTAEFGDKTLETKNVASFKSKLNGFAETINYELKFFDSSANKLGTTLNPANGVYMVTFYNNSGTDLINFTLSVDPDPATGGHFFNTEGVPLPDASHNPGDMISGAKYNVGVVCGSSETIMEISNPAGASYGFTLKTDNLSDYVDVDDNGNETGYILIHYMGEGRYLSQTQYEAELAGGDS